MISILSRCVALVYMEINLLSIEMESIIKFGSVKRQTK